MKESQTKARKRSEERDDLETIKAAAWAVFQHRNGGGSNSNRLHGAILVQQATRFKIEAQMKNELEHRSLAKEAAIPSWDAGSTLFDKYELDFVFKHLDLAFQSVDTQKKVSFDGSEYDDETTAEPAATYSSRNNQYTDAHAQSRQQRHRNGYSNSEEERPDQRDWLQSVDDSQRFRGSYLETVDESLLLAQAKKAGYEQDMNGYRHEESPKPKPVMDMETGEDTRKDVQEVVSQEKTMQFMHTPNRWNMLNGRRFSSDASPDVQKESKQSRKSKLLGIFRSKLAKDGTTPKATRQARIAPDDSSMKGRKGKTQDAALRKSDDFAVNKDVADLSPDSDSSCDSANDDGCESQEYPPQRAYQDQVPAAGLKSGLHMVIVPNFCRTVRLSSDMSNPNPDEGLRNHRRHGDLKYGPSVPASPTGRRKTSYSLNVTSPVQTPRRSMLNGSREAFRDDLDLDDTQQYHHEYHHHSHHPYHHAAHQDDDYELTVQDIERRVPRKSFEEKVAHRLSIDENTGLKAPRNSLENPFFNAATRASKLFL